MKPGDLRRFHSDFVRAGDPLCDALFMIVTTGGDLRNSILVNGKIMRGWSRHVLEKHSDAVDETR